MTRLLLVAAIALAVLSTGVSMAGDYYKQRVTIKERGGKFEYKESIRGRGPAAQAMISGAGCVGVQMTPITAAPVIPMTAAPAMPMTAAPPAGCQGFMMVPRTTMVPETVMVPKTVMKPVTTMTAVPIRSTGCFGR